MSYETLGWLGGLFASAFVSATVLPGNSEAALLAVLHFQPQTAWIAVMVATTGNVLGGLTTVWLGRRLPEPPKSRAVKWAERMGPFSLILSWFPLLGDALCGVAGWLRWPWRAVIVWITLGKAARYSALVYLADKMLN